ncbi:hypothetical protein GCM10010912_28570 [Paenibacillus albidus]|uniref:Probable cytosol aminopeptidase n=1 Tax=Paenibacillus albidus TaxID=2041023 RepID=A0A917CDW8_9BACL|nr:leucyl aminopeptidase [Paenibacillus albidus]GGF81748.1 hypothetical protein GCM10010912_28570 [Paenibacillus albidus]
MLNIEWSSGKPSASWKGDALVFILSETQVKSGGGAAEWEDRVAALGTAGFFSGRHAETYVLPLEGPYPAAILAGRGDGALTTEGLRELAAQTARAALRIKARRLVLLLPEELRTMFGEAQGNAVSALTEGLLLGAYRRRRYKQEQLEYAGLEAVLFKLEQPVEATEAGRWDRSILKGMAFGEATNLARDLINTPGNLMTPSDLAVAAIEVAERHGFPAEVLDEREIEQRGMGGLTAVGKGSANPSRMIVIRYQGTEQWDNVTGLVGKGITFDTGGISLKRAAGMENMISDMSGAAAVLGVMEALGRLRPQLNVLMVIPSAENMPSANAFKPGDVITSLSGRTIEVLNTDAEGRIVMGDALTYARHWGAERLIDVATLTGAVLSVLGDTATGALTNDEAFLQQFLEASRRAGEKIWPLPSYPEFRDALKSEVADIRNSGGRYGGATTAGLFIGEFAEGLPWIHLDIAGTAYLGKEQSVNPKGASGVMVRTLLEWLLSQSGHQE